MITGESPYAEVRRTTEVLFNMQKGLRPARPLGQKYLERGLSDNMWRIIGLTWVQEPKERLTAEQFLEELDK